MEDYIAAREKNTEAAREKNTEAARDLYKKANSLYCEYEKGKFVSNLDTDLDTVIEYLEEALGRTSDYALQGECHELLVDAYALRNEATGNIYDLQQAISSLELIIDISIDDGRNAMRSRLLSDLRKRRRQVVPDLNPKITIGEKQLGRGGNSRVYVGKFDGRDVAVKCVQGQPNDATVREIETLRKIDGHPNVIRYYYEEMQGQTHCIALDLCQASLADGVLFNEIQKGDFPPDDLPRLLLQIALGLSHLHAAGVVHRDLKPSNILLRDTNPHRLVLSDFGLAKTLDAGQSSQMYTTHAAGTFGWRAPELLKALDGSSSRLPTGKENDIFSLGLVFFYVLTGGRHPYEGGSKDVYTWERNIRDDKKKLSELKDAVAEDLIGLMLIADPKERPNIDTILPHPFFWNAERRLAFLCEASDDLEPERYVSPSAHLTELEGMSARVFTGNWELPKNLADLVEKKRPNDEIKPQATKKHPDDGTKPQATKKHPDDETKMLVTKRRSYNVTKLQELLRFVRNMCHHYHEQPVAVQNQFGPLPSGFMGFWEKHFPLLFLCCWSLSRWKTRPSFTNYYMVPTKA